MGAGGLTAPGIFNSPRAVVTTTFPAAPCEALLPRTTLKNLRRGDPLRGLAACVLVIPKKHSARSVLHRGNVQVEEMGVDW